MNYSTDMNVYVSEHAINRFRERLFDFSSSDGQISDYLQQIASEGELVREKPGSEGNIFEVVHNGISVVLIRKGNKTAVLTCLGDSAYRNWTKRQNLHGYIGGRILYPGKVV